MVKWRRPQIRATDPGPEAPSRSEGSSCGRDGEPGRWPPPAPSVRPSPRQTALILAPLGGAICGILEWWLRPHGVMIVVVLLASVLLAMTTGFAERVIPVPREDKENRP